MLNAKPYQNYIQKALQFISLIKQEHQPPQCITLCTDTRQYKIGDVLVAYNIPHSAIKHQVSNFEYICKYLNEYVNKNISNYTYTYTDDTQYEIYIIADAYFLTHIQAHATDLHHTIQKTKNINIIYLPDLYKYLGHIISIYDEYPSHKQPIIGITGTNGKTTISHWLAQCINALHQNQHATCVIGTLGNGYLNDLQATGFTTPDVIQLHKNIKDFSQQINTKSLKAISMEVSSHGLIQHRVAGIQFHTGIFTNLSQDHLDYHLTFQEYAYAKSILFQSPALKYAVINADDDFGLDQINNKYGNLTYIAYGKDEQKLITCSQYNYIYLKNAEIQQQGYLINLVIMWQNKPLEDEIYVPILGEFNLYNLMAVIGALLTLQYTWNTIKQVISTSIFKVKGRLEAVLTPYANHTQISKLVLVDYAHTPDALEKTLKTLQIITNKRQGKLYCVFGCGGNRDKTKRPIMSNIAATHADVIFITSDNPRFEKAEDIVRDMLQGLKGNGIEDRLQVIIDRKKAIQAAIKHMQINDVLVIAGKGHECYQEINGIKYAFSDTECAEQALN